jgi:hypothetical protein
LNADLADFAERQVLAVLVADGDSGRRQRKADRAREIIGESKRLTVATGEVSDSP